MLKRLISLFLLLILLTACSNIKIYEQKKPSDSYYTKLLMSQLKADKNFSILLLDTTFYKKITLDKAEADLVKNSILFLTNGNFIERPKTLKGLPCYKLYFTFHKTEYVCDVYNEEYMSIYPWDGSFKQDYICISKLPLAYNLFDFCKALIPRN